MNQLCNGTSVQTTFSHLSPPYRSLSAFTRTPFTPTINTQSDRLAACGRAHTFGSRRSHLNPRDPETQKSNNCDGSPDDDIHDQTVARQAHHEHHRVDRHDDGDDRRHGLVLGVPGGVRGVVEEFGRSGLPGEVRDALLRLPRGTPVLLVDVYHAAVHGAEASERATPAGDR